MDVVHFHLFLNYLYLNVLPHVDDESLKSVEGPAKTCVGYVGPEPADVNGCSSFSQSITCVHVHQ